MGLRREAVVASLLGTGRFDLGQGSVGGSQGDSTGPHRVSAVLPTLCRDPLGGVGLGAGLGGMLMAGGAHGRELKEAPTMGFQGRGVVKTLRGGSQKTEKLSLNCKTEFISFGFQRSSWPPAGKKEICDVCRGSGVCLNLQTRSTGVLGEAQVDIKGLEGQRGAPRAMGEDQALNDQGEGMD